MSAEFELFPGKNLSGLFEDIYNNQINKKKHISEIIHEIRKGIRHAGDLAVLGPVIKDLIDTSVRNEENPPFPMKMATKGRPPTKNCSLTMCHNCWRKCIKMIRQ